MLLRLVLFVSGIIIGVSTFDNLQTCKNTKVEENVTLRGGIGAGTFKKLAKVTSMASCLELCCKNPSCDVAFLSGLKCYGVECVNDDECESTATDTSETKVLIAHVRTGKKKGNKSSALASIPKHNILASKPVLGGLALISKAMGPQPSKGLVPGSIQTSASGPVSPLSPASGKQKFNKEKKPVSVDISPGMAGQCKPGKEHKEVTLKGGINAGTYKDIGAVKSMDDCSKKCCSFAPCDLAFVLQGRCYLVGCTDGKSCQLQKAKSSPYNPSVMYVTRWNNEGVKHTINVQDDTSSNFMCSPMKLMSKVTLKGGLKSGDFTDTGKVGNIGECYDLCCRQPTCNLAFMLGQNCFSVKCFTKDLCSTIPAQPSIYNPQIAYVWNRKEIAAKDKEQSSKKSEILKPPPPCPKTKILEHMTLVGGLNAGNFHDNGKVQDVDQCRRICCEMPKCNLAFMLGANCFSVECKTEALCKTQAAQPSKFFPRISYVRPFGSTVFVTAEEAKAMAEPVAPVVLPVAKQLPIAAPTKPILQEPKPVIPGLPKAPDLTGMLASVPETNKPPIQQANNSPNIPGLPMDSGIPGLPVQPAQLPNPVQQAQTPQLNDPLSALNKPSAEPALDSNLLSLPGQPQLPQQGQPFLPPPNPPQTSLFGQPPANPLPGMNVMQNPLLPPSNVPEGLPAESVPAMQSPMLPSPSQTLDILSPQSQGENPSHSAMPMNSLKKPEDNTQKKTEIPDNSKVTENPSKDSAKKVNLTNTINGAKPGQAMSMKIVDGKLQLQPVADSKSHNAKPNKSKNNTSSSAGAFDAILGGGESSDDKCMATKIIVDVTLKGGKKAGKFKDHGDVKNMRACKSLCCKDDKCNLAFMLEKTCYTVTCKSKDLCDNTPAPPSDFRPRISYIRPPKESSNDMKDLPVIPKDPNNLRCKHSNITNNKVFNDAIGEDNSTIHHDIQGMPKCMEKCCENRKCDIAYFLDNKCYTVSCSNKEACKPISAQGKPKGKIPLMSAMLTKPKDEEDEVTEFASDLGSHKSPVSEEVTDLLATKARCRSNRISSGITLKNGNRASNFTAMGQVESLKKCIALCCVRPACDIAYLENNKCFAVQCNDGVMCQTNAHQADIGMNVKLAYMDRNSPSVKDRDWMIVYIIVGSLAFAAVIGGAIWGVCVCTKRNKIGKQRRLLDDEDDEDDEMLPKPTQTRYRTPMHRY